METIKGFLEGVFSQGSKKEDDAEVQSSSDEDNEGAPSNNNNDRHVTFEVQSETDEDKNTDDNGEGGKSNNMNMNGMEYLTQPDQEEESDDDQSTDNNNNNKMQVEEHTPPPPSSSSKKRRAHKYSVGDSLTQLDGSPEGRQHSSTIKSTKPPQPLQNSTTLSQAVVNSPLKSPSPLTMMMSQQTAGAMLSNPLQSPLVDDKTSTNMKSNESDSISVSEYKLKDANLQAESTPTEDDAPMDESTTIDNNDKKQPAIEEEDEIIDFGTTTDPTINGFHDIPSKEKQLLLHKLNMKKQAIYRSLLHLSDNSYSFVYDESSSSKEDTVMNDDDEPGLPYIGPHLKDDYKVLRTMLRRGLLGITDDNDINSDNSTTTRMDTTAEEEDGMNNPFLPKIKANVSAVLMGPRGHGKTLVLERCLASLSRLAAKRKEQVLDQMMESNPRQAEEMYSQASFRVVRLNGLLFQGDSAVACTREIARQIGVMSREERKRTRKIMKQMNTNKRKLQGVTDDLETPSFKRQRKKDKGSSRKSGSSAQKKHPSNGDTPLPNLTQTPSDNPTPNNTIESHDLRNRRSGFNTYIALLDEVLRTARVDGIPILIVLDELQAFLNSGRSANTDVEGQGSSMQQDVGSSDRQLLLYHLLDRVADHKFLVSVVGLTTDLRAVTKLEKRVQSRAEGTSKIIYFGHNKDFDELAKCLLGKFYTPPEERSSGESNNDMVDIDEEDEYSEQMAMVDIREEVKVILTGGKSNSNRLMSEEEEENGEINDFALVQRVLERNYSLIGSDMRWICRVFDVALGLLVSDIDERIHECMESNDDNCGDDENIPTLSASHVAKALITMNASMDDVSSTIGRPGIPSQSTLELISWGKLLGDSKHYSCLVGTHPRLVALLDLSGPQVAALLAARRIEARDDARANAGEDEIESRRRRGLATNDKTASTSLPLTYKRIEDEYTTSFVASGRYTISSDRYPKHVLYQSFMDLMEMDIIRLKKEICGGGALQYGHNDALFSGSNMSGLPLYVNLDYDLELMPILKAGMLQCSTALREWGLKMN